MFVYIPSPYFTLYLNVRNAHTHANIHTATHLSWISGSICVLPSPCFILYINSRNAHTHTNIHTTTHLSWTSACTCCDHVDVGPHDIFVFKQFVFKFDLQKFKNSTDILATGCVLWPWANIITICVRIISQSILAISNACNVLRLRMCVNAYASLQWS